MASSSQTNRGQRAQQIWKDFSEFLLADERHLDVFSCGICEKIMLGVTVVTKCQHGFCALCIRNYFLKTGIHKCPKCLVELGDNPEEYLRFDALVTDLLGYAVDYHLLRIEAEADAVQPPPEPNTQVSDVANEGSNA